MKIKTAFFLSVCLMLSGIVYAQEIVNIVLVGDDGVTEDIKKAHSFVAVKKYPGNIFERLDYKIRAPLTKLRTYNDSNLTNLEGKYLEYFSSGELHISGRYSSNLKTGDWMIYNDTGKIVLIEKYKNGDLLETENPDTVKKKEPVLYGDEKEAEMKGGTKKWVKYLVDNISPDAGLKSLQGGKVRVLFIVNTAGKTTEVYLKKSVEFILDEEALRVIRESPTWEPAFQNGHKVNAYRIQPLTFVKE